MSHPTMTRWNLACETSNPRSAAGFVRSCPRRAMGRVLLALAVLWCGRCQTASAQPVDMSQRLSEARRVFIPAEDLDVVLEQDQRGAMLTKKKYDELMTLARENAAKHSAPNVAMVLTGSDYQARIVGDQLLLTVTAELTQFASDWQAIAFPLQRLSVEKAMLDDQPAMLGRNQDGSVTLLCDVRGKHTLKLELSTELNSIGSDQVAMFSLLRAPSGNLSLTLPAGKRLLVGSLQLERPAPLDQAADYKVAIGGAPGIQLRITDRAAENAADALTIATTGYGLHVAPGEVTWHALTTLQIFGKPVDRLTFSVPSELEIADVEATGLESWDLKDDPNDKQRTVISLTFGQAFDGSRKISLKGVMAVEGDKPWSVPPVAIANVTSHIGQVLIQHPAGVRLRVEETVGVRRAAQGEKPSADMPDEMSKLNATEFLRFDIWQPDFVLRLTTQPKQRELQTAVAAVLDVNARGLDLQALVTVKTQFAPLFELDIRLPADWTVLSAQRDGVALKWQVLPQDPGINQLRILLSPPLAAEASGTVHLSLRREVEGWPVEADPITVDLPELFLPQSNLSEGTYVVRGDDDLDLATLDMTGLDTVPLKADFERLRFQSQDTRYSGKLKVTRKPSRISVQTITVSRLDPQTMHAFLQALVEVQGGGVRTLKVELPEMAGTALRFQSPGRQIVEQKPGAAVNGKRIWTLQFDQRVRGGVPIFGDIELPRAGAAEFSVPQARFVDAERQNGYQAVEAGGEQRLTIDARGADDAPLAEVDPLELPSLYYTPKERIVAVYQNVAPGAKVKLSEERFEKLAVPTAVCPMLNVTSVLGRTGELQHRANFQLLAVGVQGLRVTLPLETLLWATLVDGQPVEVRRQGDIYLIPLKAVSAGTSGPNMGHAYQLQLFYRSEVSALTRFGTLKQPPPELSVQTGQGTSQAVDVLDQRWQLHYPARTLMVGSDGPLEPEQKLDEPSLLGRFNAGTRIPTLEELGWQALAVVGALGAIALVVMLCRARRYEVLACLILVVGIGGGISFLMLLGGNSHYKEVAKSTMKTKELSSAHYYADFDVDRSGMPPAATTAAPAGPKGEWMDEPKSEPKREVLEELKSEERKEMPKFDDADAGVEGNMPSRTKSRPAEPAPDFAPPQAADRPLAGKDGIAQHMAQNEARDEAAAVIVPAPVAMPKPDPSSGKERLGLLSLAIDLTPPEGSLLKTFRYAGADPVRGGIELKLSYVDEQTGQVVRIFLVAMLALAGWFSRRISCSQKVVAAGLGLTIPLALLPLVPHALQVVLDGLFFGTVVVCGLWLIVGIVRGLPKSCLACCRWTKSAAPASPTATVPVWVVVSLLVGSACQAQPTQAPALPPGGPVPTPPGNGPMMPAQAVKPVSPHSETTIFVPFDAGTEPQASERVFLPYNQFMQLYRQAYPDKQVKGPAPVDGGVVEALYSAKVVPNEKTPDESSVEVTARFAVRSYVDGQLQVELPVGAVAVREARLDGANAPLIMNGACMKVAISKPGLHVVDLVFSIPARLSGSTGTFSLPLLPVPSGKLSFVLPAKDLSIRINGSSTIFRRVTQGEVQAIEVPVDRGGELAIAWQPEQARGVVAAAVHVDSVQAITLTDAGIRVSTGFQYRVRQGGIADVTFSLPATYRLQAVNGSDVGGWELQGEGDARKLRVIFRRNITDTTQLTVETYLDSKVGAEATVIEIPQLSPNEVTNEIGQVAIFSGSQFTLRADKSEGLSQIDADKFSTTVPVSRPGVAPQLAYRFSKRPFALSLRAARQESQANVVAQQAAFVTLRKQQLSTRLLYNLTGAPRSSFSLALPPGYVVLDVKATGLHDWSLGKQGEQSLLTIDLNGPRLGLAEVVLSGTVPRDHNATIVELEFPRPLDATKLNSTAAIWLDEGFTGTLDRFEGWRSVDAGLVGGQLKAVRPNLPVQFAFQSTGPSPSAITLALQQAAPKLGANGLAMVSVTDVAVVHTLALQWQIDAATTDSLVFTTPSFLAGKLEFTGNGIRETTHVDAGNGRTRWTIWLRTPIRGRYFAAAVGTLPPAAGEVQAPSIVFERGHGSVDPVDGQRQYVLLINLSQSQLTSATPELSESVQREDVPVVVDQSLVDQATELVRVKQLLTAPKWTMQSYAQSAGAPASVNVADLTTIVSRDGTYRGQAVYTIKNRSRQFLALKLPENAELMSVFVGNLPARAVTTKRNNQTLQLVALPKTSAASLSFPVRVIWRGRLGGDLPRSARLLRQEVDFPAPVVVSLQDDADFGIPVARTRWTVWLPDDLDAKPLTNAARHNMTLQQADQKDLLYEKAAVQEISELLGYVEQNYDVSSKSEQRRSQASNNMKQIGLALHNAKQLEDSVRRVDGDDDFRRQRDVALRRLSELQQSIVAEQQTIVGQGQAQAGRGLTVVPGTSPVLTDGTNFSNVIANNGLGINAQPILSNTFTLLNDNRGQGAMVQTQDGATEFSFELENKEDGKKVAAPGDKPSGEGTKGNGLETRQKLQRGNDANIDALNSSINDQKLAGQQAVQGRYAQPPMVNGPGGGPQLPGTPVGLPGGPYGMNPGNYNVSGGFAGVNFGNSTVNGNGVVDARNPGQPGRGGNLWMGNPNSPPGGGAIDPSMARNWRITNSAESGGAGGGGAIQFNQFNGGNFGPMDAAMPDDLQKQLRNMAPMNPAGGLVQQGVVDGLADQMLIADAEEANGGEGLGAMGGGGWPAWTQTGGLSLGFELPTTGKRLVFSKAGGEPKLALAVRPRETIRWGMNLAWSAIWLSIGALIVFAVRSASGTRRLTYQLPVAAAVVSLLGFFVLPTPLNGIAFLTFIASSIVVAWNHRRGPGTTASVSP
jgi:hypothetical protein